MKIRFKFRNKFHVHELSAESACLIDLLRAVSELFKVALPNVQVSLNAKDYVGLAESELPISTIGIVNGDIVYVQSLESLDDIRRYMEHELVTSLDALCNRISLPYQNITSLFSLPVYLCARAKNLQSVDELADVVSSAANALRLQFVYASNPETHFNFTVYTTGNLICMAASCKEIQLAQQLVLPLRDHLFVAALLSQEITPTPSFLFKDLQLLSNRIKDELIEPVLVNIHEELGMPERIMLTNLPFEILTRIFLYTPLFALGKLMLCNSFLYQQIKSCAPVWRSLLANLNAKKQPLLEAALTRQLQMQKQQQQLQPPQATTPVATGGSTVSGPNETNAPDDLVPIEVPSTEEDPSLDESPGHPTLPYERFVARYRSLLNQRRTRGLSPIFV